jgi:hypothetical protein
MAGLSGAETIGIETELKRGGGRGKIPSVPMI